MAATNEKKQVAADLQAMINDTRDRKKNEALAAKIFGKDRRSSTPASNSNNNNRGSSNLGGSLTSRAGITKQRSNNNKPRASTGNIEGEWYHDLHGASSSGGSGHNSPRPGGSSLASRISNPNAGPAGNPRQKRRAAQVAEALIRTELLPASAKRAAASSSAATSSPGGAQSFNKGLTIRGLAGPFVVMAQNFAPGTTAADIESAMTPVGGIISSCRLLKTHPIVIAEIVFESREGAENVIATFDNQTADGRVLSVYPKAGGGTSPAPTSSTPAIPTGPRNAANPPTGPRAHRQQQRQQQTANDNVVDGTMGFADPMETDDLPSGNGRQPPRGPRGGLYSDGLVRGGRGRGRGGGGGRR